MILYTPLHRHRRMQEAAFKARAGHFADDFARAAKPCSIILHAYSHDSAATTTRLISMTPLFARCCISLRQPPTTREKFSHFRQDARRNDNADAARKALTMIITTYEPSSPNGPNRPRSIERGRIPRSHREGAHDEPAGRRGRAYQPMTPHACSLAGITALPRRHAVAPKSSSSALLKMRLMPPLLPPFTGLLYVIRPRARPRRQSSTMPRWLMIYLRLRR